MEKFTKSLRYCALVALGLALCSFCTFKLFLEEAAYLEQKLVEHYDLDQESPEVLHFELKVTNTGFCRYKRYFANGKIEYFSFNSAKFKNLDYSGTPESGRLFLHTISDDVIVQTFNDRNGDIDSMATFLAIPQKDMGSADLKNLAEMFQRLHLKLQQPQ